MYLSTVINFSLHACVYGPCSLPSPLSDSTGFYQALSVALALFFLVPCISQMDGPAMEAARLPVTTTVNMGAQCLAAGTICTCSFVFEYELSPPLSAPPSSLLCEGVKQVWLSSVYSVCPPLAPPFLLGLSRRACFVQELGSSDVSLYVPVEHL